MRNSFVFYRSFFDAVKHLKDNERLEVYEAIMCYSLDSKEPELEGYTKTIFLLIKPLIDKNNQRYENGKKGGRKPKNNQPKTNAEPSPSNDEDDNVNEESDEEWA